MTNLLTAADQVRQRGMLFAPAALARISMIDPADVAAVAAVTLTTPGHDGRTDVLTGPEAISYAQVAAILSTTTGQSVGYANVPPEAAGQALVDAGLPPFAVDQLMAVFAALRKRPAGPDHRHRPGHYRAKPPLLRGLRPGPRVSVSDRRRLRRRLT